MVDYDFREVLTQMCGHFGCCSLWTCVLNNNVQSYIVTGVSYILPITFISLINWQQSVLCQIKKKKTSVCVISGLIVIKGELSDSVSGFIFPWCFSPIAHYVQYDNPITWDSCLPLAAWVELPKMNFTTYCISNSKNIHTEEWHT